MPRCGGEEKLGDQKSLFAGGLWMWGVQFLSLVGTILQCTVGVQFKCVRMNVCVCVFLFFFFFPFFSPACFTDRMFVWISVLPFFVKAKKGLSDNPKKKISLLFSFIYFSLIHLRFSASFTRTWSFQRDTYIWPPFCTDPFFETLACTIK